MTRKCLSDKKVRRELGDAADDVNNLIVALQEANTSACNLLSLRGYDVDLMRVEANSVPKTPNITEPHSQERILLLSKAKTHGEKFTATGGAHLTSDDFFKAMEVPVREKEVKAMEDDKVRRMLLEANEKTAIRLLVGNSKVLGPTPESRGRDFFTGDDLDLFMKWHQVPPKEVDNKAKKWARWRMILLNRSPPRMRNGELRTRHGFRSARRCELTSTTLRWEDIAQQ